CCSWLFVLNPEDRYWLPPNMTWDDMERLAPSERPLPRDLFVALPLALGFVVLRYMFERVNSCEALLWKIICRSSPLWYFQSDIIHLMSLCGKSQRQIETWFRLRRHQDKPCQTKKFGEATAGGPALTFIPLHPVPLFLINCPMGTQPVSIMSLNLPQPMQSRHFWYYMLELGFYGSLLLRISVDIKRKDFKEQVIHHLATVFLLSFSYCANYIRIGTLVMLLHDSADILLESAKMFNYGSGWKKACDILFVVFASVFFLTRLVIFPSKIMHTTLVLSMENCQPFAGYYFFNILLMVLQGLHVFWASLILRMVPKFLTGKVRLTSAQDKREEAEEDYCLTERKGTQSYKLAPLSKNCVLNNLTNHRASISGRLCKAQ
uniref:Ceramide synthase 2-like n=1 Tax=Hippocampus comes TaxID=109280 RepID=A0A3Q2XMW8_HIPCM